MHATATDRMIRVGPARWLAALLTLLLGYLGCAEDQRILPDSTPPAAVDDLMAYLVTDSSVSVTWTAPGNDGTSGTATEYDLRYSTSPIADSVFHAATRVAPQPIPSPAGRADSASIGGLDPYTAYFIAIKTGDNRNWSDLSNVVAVTTELGDLDIIPPSAVTDLTVVAVSNHSATLTWTASGDDGDEGRAATHDLRYSFTAGGDSTWWAEGISVPGLGSPGLAGSQERVVVEQLLADTTYYFALVVADERPNESGLSNIAIAVTPPDTLAPAAPTDLAIATRTHDSITLVWSAVGDDGIDAGPAFGYDLRYSTTPGDDLDWFAAADTASGEPAPGPVGRMEDFTVGGLEPETFYYFALRVRDEVPNWSGLSNVVADSTAVAPDSIPPGAITGLTAEVTGDTEITLSWSAPGEADGSVYAIEYEARYTTGRLDEETWDDATAVANLPAPAPPGQLESIAIAGLESNRRYSFALRWASQDTVWSDLTESVSGITPLIESTPLATLTLPAGEYVMGDGASYCGNEEHPVTLTRAFELGQYEITNQQYLERVQWAYNHGLVHAEEATVVDAASDSGVELLDLDAAGCEIAFTHGVFSLRSTSLGTLPDHPVKEVSWYGAAAFCDWLNEYHGIAWSYDHTTWEPAGASLYQAAGYRLPTDAEWEYAARDGDPRIFPWGNENPDCSRANYWDCQVGGSAAVGSYPPAPRIGDTGFFDLAGNLWEWCHDWHVCNLGLDPVVDPEGPGGGSLRLLRGSSWYLADAQKMRCSYRGQALDPEASNERIGFRIARTDPGSRTGGRRLP